MILVFGTPVRLIILKWRLNIMVGPILTTIASIYCTISNRDSADSVASINIVRKPCSVSNRISGSKKIRNIGKPKVSIEILWINVLRIFSHLVTLVFTTKSFRRKTLNKIHVICGIKLHWKTKFFLTV